MRTTLLVLTSLVVASANVARADQPPPPRSIYRFDVSITGVEATPVVYTLVLEEGRAGALSTGTNVPLATSGAASPRQDVGLSVRLEYALQGAVVVLEGSVELSSVAATSGRAATIQRIRIEGVTPVRAGAPALLGSAVDVASGRRYEVTITAQRLL